MRSSINTHADTEIDSNSNHWDALSHRCGSSIVKGVRFSDGSSPGRENIPEDTRSRVPCYEPSPQALWSSENYDIPERSWADMLRRSSDINTLKDLLEKTTLEADSTDDLPSRSYSEWAHLLEQCTIGNLFSSIRHMYPVTCFHSALGAVAPHTVHK